MLLIAAVFSLCTPDAALGQAGNDAASQPTQDEVVFVPPAIGVPADRLGAGTRDVTAPAGPLLLLVPDGGGLTTNATPPLVWLLTDGFRGTMTAAISAIGAPGVALEQRGAFPKGHYGLDLRRSDYRLDEGTIYEWSVTLTDNSGVLAEATGLVERIPPQASDPGPAGIWFDALAPLVTFDLSGRVRVSDRQQLNRLLTAGGLEE